jgi:hypothetical protein
MFEVFDTFYDILWIIILYVVLYFLVDKILSDYSSIFKELFNIEIRYYNYTRETDLRQRHDIIHTLASSIAFLILSLSPVVYSLLFLVVFNMVDVVQLNRINLVLVLLRLLYHTHTFDKIRLHDFKPWKNVDNGFLLFQLVYVVFNYSNVLSIFPVVFQLIDDLFTVDTVVKKIKMIYSNVFNCESWVTHYMVKFISWHKRNITLLQYTRFAMLLLVLMVSFLWSDFHNSSDFVFFYYCVFRLTQVYFQINH